MPELLAVTGTNELPEKVSPTYNVLDTNALATDNNGGSLIVKLNGKLDVTGISSVTVTVYFVVVVRFAVGVPVTAPFADQKYKPNEVIEGEPLTLKLTFPTPPVNPTGIYDAVFGIGIPLVNGGIVVPGTAVNGPE